MPGALHVRGSGLVYSLAKRNSKRMQHLYFDTITTASTNSEDFSALREYLIRFHPQTRLFLTGYEQGLKSGTHLGVDVRRDEHGDLPSKELYMLSRIPATSLPNPAMPHVAVSRKQNDNSENAKLTFIRDQDPFYDAFVFPVMNPTGQRGPSLTPDICTDEGDEDEMEEDCDTALKKRRRSHVTLREVGLYHLYRNPLLRGMPLLLQEVILNYWIRVEDFRLHYHNASNARLARDTEISVAGETRAGKKLLPSSFVNGPRYWRDKRIDLCAIVHHFGAPTHFITVTANPKWHEITEQVPAGCSVLEIPHIVQRVFVERGRRLIAHLREKELFGSVRAMSVRMEWQKRGLPHYHILLFAHREETISGLDEVVSAQLPREDNCHLRGNDLSRARLLVKKHLTHRCCFKCERRAGENSKYCKYGFGSNGIVPVTFVGDNGRYVLRRCHEEDEMIVSHNLELTMFWDGHVNVLPVRDSRTIGYVTKYNTKPEAHSESILRSEDKDDEIKVYAQTKITGGSEAAARLIGKSHTVWSLYPSVRTIKLHPEEDKRIRYLTSFNPNVVLGPGGLPKLDDSLTQYFERPSTSSTDPLPNFDAMTCLEYSSNYFVTSAKTFTFAAGCAKRDAGVQVSTGILRMNIGGVPLYLDSKVRPVIARKDSRYVADKKICRFAATFPQMGEIHWMRRILVSRPSRSHKDLRTNRETGHESETYADAAVDQGFVDSTDPTCEWHLVFKETVERQGTPSNLRGLFVYAVAQDGADGYRLWECYAEHLCADWALAEDVLRASCDDLHLEPGTSGPAPKRTVEEENTRKERVVAYAKSLTLQSLHERVEKTAPSDNFLPFPQPETNLPCFERLARHRRLLRSELDDSLEIRDGDNEELLQRDVLRLRPGQKEAYETVLNAAAGRTGQCFYLGARWERKELGREVLIARPASPTDTSRCIGNHWNSGSGV